jgi:hypothetical protein
MRPFRQELKFLIHHSVRRILLERWRRYLVRAPFTNRHAVNPVLSQYYDSPHLIFYHEKLAGIRLRNKVRLRTYGREFQRGRTTILEIKYRRDDLVRKLRHPIPDFDESQLDPTRWRFENPVVRSAFLGLLERYRLRPSAQVYYQREAYQGLVEGDVRITFDTCLVGLHPGERLTRELLFDPSRRLLPDTLAILEVKTTSGIPGWVHDGVLAGELQQQTLPKYVTAVEVLELTDLSSAGVYV